MEVRRVVADKKKEKTLSERFTEYQAQKPKPQPPTQRQQPTIITRQQGRQQQQQINTNRRGQQQGRQQQQGLLARPPYPPVSGGVSKPAQSAFPRRSPTVQAAVSRGPNVPPPHASQIRVLGVSGPGMGSILASPRGPLAHHHQLLVQQGKVVPLIAHIPIGPEAARKGKGGAVVKEVKKDKKQLDEELDSYFMKDADAAQQRLDTQMDEYFRDGAREEDQEEPLDEN